MFSRIVAALSLLTVVLGTINTVLQALVDPATLALLPPAWSGTITVVAAVFLALSRALVDADGNGVPDLFEAKRLTVHLDGEKIGETTLAAMQRKEARQVRAGDELGNEEGG